MNIERNQLSPETINKILTQHNFTFKGIGPTVEGEDFNVIPQDEYDLQELVLYLKKYSALLIPSGTTGNRPTFPTDGTLRFNTDLGSLETYSTSGGWDAYAYLNNSHLTSKIYFVSKAYGSTSGEKGNIFAPYNNPWTVASLMEAGDIMWILDGTYTATNVGGGGDKEVAATANSQSLIPATWTSGEYTMYFTEGVRIEDNSTVAQSSGNLFNITQPITVNVLGYGEFFKTQSNGTLEQNNFNIINVSNSGATINFEANLLQNNKGQILFINAVNLLKLKANNIIWRGDFGLTLSQMLNGKVNIDAKLLQCAKFASGGIDYTNNAIQIHSIKNSNVSVSVDYLEAYSLSNLISIKSPSVSPNFESNLINLNINTIKVTNDSTGATITDFTTLEVASLDAVGNTTSIGTQMINIVQDSGEFLSNTVAINVGSVDGVRLRPITLDLGGSPTNNLFNINIGALYSTNTNAIAINTIAGATNTVNINGNVVITTGALIKQADASSAAKVYLSGVWASNADLPIIASAGSGLVLKGFIGRGGSTASPITTSAGNVAVLSAAFNNVTAITGTVVGATPLQNAAF